MRSLMLLFNVTVMLLVLAVVAFAGDRTVGDNIVEMMQQTVFPVLSALLMTLATIAIRKLTKKWGAEGLVADNQLIERVAVRGIGLAEEMAERMIKDQADKRLSGNNKLVIAVDHLRQTIPAIDHDHAVSIVEGLLARTYGAGATGTKVF